MQKNKWIALLFITCSSLMFYTSCHKEGENVSAISVNGGTKSHNNGTDCMTCHKKSGKGAGAGWFVIAGSVYKPDQITANPNTTIHLYTAQNGGGVEVAKIQVDAYGNFYTTDGLDFGNGLYPAVEGASGAISYMNSFTSTGDCNGCHVSGSQTGRVFGN